MYTQCPNCDTIFTIVVAQLKVAHGRVRCGHCDTIFDALHNLAEQLPTTLPVLQEVEASDRLTTTSQKPADKEPETPNPATIGTAADAAPKILESIHPTPQETGSKSAVSEIKSIKSAKPGRLSYADATLDGGTLTLLTNVSDFQPLRVDVPIDLLEKHAPADTGVDEEIEFHWDSREEARPDDDEAPGVRQRRGGFSILLWSLGILILLGLLAAQYAYFMRADLASHASLRPTLEKLCTQMHLECNLPLRRNLGLLEVRERDLSPHPTVQNALLVKATLVNKAPFTQPYPILQLTFTDANGTSAVTRDFQAAEYLNPGTDFKQGMSPAATVPILMELSVPSFNPSAWDVALY